MIIFKTVAGLKHHLGKPGLQHQSIGFVPTMGALHPGHLSLLQQSKRISDITVASIFVNPTQFNDPKDFEKYPVTIDKDCQLLEQEKTDILFLPSVNEMYPNGTGSLPHFSLGELETLLEGRYRPGHFQGVCQVVQRLLQLVQPDHLLLGQKDYQQCMVLKKLVHQMQISTQLHIAPTLREENGLAMSSRNLRLTPEQRSKATAIYAELLQIRQSISTGSLSSLKQSAARQLLTAGFSGVDYVEIADAQTLHPLEHVTESTAAVALIAAYMGEIRLIDNMLLNTPAGWLTDSI